jgi:mycoredoxin
LDLGILRRILKTSPDAAIADPASPSKSGAIVVYGTAWCGDCWRAKRFLDRHQVTHRWIDVDRDRAALEHVLALNHGMRAVPTLVFPDGSTLTEPSNAELARKLRIDS